MKAFYPENTTVIICCAGMGTRLGIGTTKALVDICGKPLIIHLLEQLKEYDDIRIVVGFQAERLIQIVKVYRKDIVYAFNHDYESTGVADSLKKALVGVREYAICVDGDTLVNPEDFKRFLNIQEECLGVSAVSSAETVLAAVENTEVVKLSKQSGNAQWSSLVKLESNRIKGNSPHVYENLNNVLPMKAVWMRTRSIDTPEDYEQAIAWVEDGFQE